MIAKLTQVNKVKINRVITKSVSTPNESKNLWTSLNPISQNVQIKGENFRISNQTNVKSRIEDITTTYNAAAIQEFLDQDYYTLLKSKKDAKGDMNKIYH